MNEKINLRGIDGANPLGFLAAVGVMSVLGPRFEQAKLAWQLYEGRWQPVLSGVVLKAGNPPEEALSQELNSLLKTTSDEAFEVNAKLPFPSALFADRLVGCREHTTQGNRRTADLFAGYGSEVIMDDKGTFGATAFCMVRSGDSAGNGLPAYALKLRNACGEKEIWRTLFTAWNYMDEGPSLRWDPVEDRRYALNWHDPSSQAKRTEKKPVMVGANVLALEALGLFPSVPNGSRLQTTGFSSLTRKRTVFTWPIWESWLGIGELRSTVGLAELRKAAPDRVELKRRGIVEIFRSDRIAANQYYKNLTPARPA